MSGFTLLVSPQDGDVPAEGGGARMSRLGVILQWPTEVGHLDRPVQSLFHPNLRGRDAGAEGMG